MKHSLIGLGCFLLILAMPTQAKTVFALNQQFYANSINETDETKHGPMKPGRYDTGDAILSMNLSRLSTGVYSTINARNDGYLIVDVKEPTKDWATNISVKYGFSSVGGNFAKPKTYTIRLSDSNGESLFFSTKRTSISIQDSLFNLKQNLHATVLNFFAETKGEEIIIKVNGSTFVTMPRGSFSSLKTLEMDIGYHGGEYTFVNNVSISQK